MLVRDDEGVPEGAPLAKGIGRVTSLEWAMLLCGVASVSFHLWLVVSGLVPNLVTRPIHLLLAIPWIFVFQRSTSRAERLLGHVLGALGAFSALYIVLMREALADQYGSLEGWPQYAVSFILILCVLEMARRAIQFVLPMVAAIVLLYGYFGWLIPGAFGHAGLPLSYFLGTLVVAEGGLWSSLTGLSAEVVAPFIVLGAFISAGAAGSGFMALAVQLAGRFRAGAAKVSVLASAMYGTISGSAAANTASTGMVTIPAMKRLGYPPALAAAVEAVASTGGQIMPPIMGAGVFVMAELLRTSYQSLMVAGLLPAFLFFATAWFGVHQFAIRHGLAGIAKDDLPGWSLVLRTVPFFLVPFGILVWALAFTPYTAPYAAAFATAVTMVLLLADSRARIRLDRWVMRIWAACIEAGRQIAAIAAIIICASLIVGVFHMTGLGVKITSLIIGAAGGNLWVALFLTGLSALVLGMELPTTAAYIICIAVAGPALTELGLPELYAHFFVFWYALLCTITPPVCGNVFIAAGIAETPWLPVAWHSMQLGIGLFLVPLGFVANPALLQLASEPFLGLLALLKVGLGIWLLSFAAIDPLQRPWLRPLGAGLGLSVLFLMPVG